MLRKATRSGLPKWFEAFSPVNKLFPDNLWKWFSQIYWKKQDVVAIRWKVHMYNRRDCVLPALLFLSRICERIEWWKCVCPRRWSHLFSRHREEHQGTIRSFYDSDTPTGNRPEKLQHYWQQNIQEYVYRIECFCLLLISTSFYFFACHPWKLVCRCAVN